MARVRIGAAKATARACPTELGITARGGTRRALCTRAAPGDAHQGPRRSQGRRRSRAVASKASPGGTAAGSLTGGGMRDAEPIAARYGRFDAHRGELGGGDAGGEGGGVAPAEDPRRQGAIGPVGFVIEHYARQRGRVARQPTAIVVRQWARRRRRRRARFTSTGRGRWRTASSRIPAVSRGWCGARRLLRAP